MLEPLGRATGATRWWTTHPHPRTPTPLSTNRAQGGGAGSASGPHRYHSGPSSYPYSPKCPEEEFSEVRPLTHPRGVLCRCTFGDGADPEGHEHQPQNDRPVEDPLDYPYPCSACAQPEYDEPDQHGECQRQRPGPKRSPASVSLEGP